MVEPDRPAATLSWTLKEIFVATLVVVAVAAGTLLLYAIRLVVFLLFAAIVLATAIKPLVAWLEQRGSSRWLAVGGLYTVLGAALVGGIVVGGPLLLGQLIDVGTAFPQAWGQLRQHVAQLPSVFVQRIVSRLPEVPWAPANPQELAEQALATALQTVRYAGLAVRGGFAVLAVLLLSFYWSLQEERTIRWCLLLLPDAWRDWGKDLVVATQTKVGGYVRGQGILCGTVAALALVAYWLIGLPYAVVLAVLAGILEAVPYFGPILGAVPPLLVALSIDPTKAIWVVVASVAIQQTENYLLVPRVMDRSVGVHPLVTLLAIAAFGTLLGIAGAVLAIPLAAIIQTFLERSLLSPQALTPPEPAGREAVDLLRYQIQELLRDIRLRERDKAEPVTPAADRVEDSLEAIARDLEQSLPQEERR